VITEESQFNKSSAVIHCSTSGQANDQNLQDPNLPSSSLVPYVDHNIEQADITISENKDINQQIQGVLLKPKDTHKESHNRPSITHEHGTSIYEQGRAILTQTYELSEYAIPRRFIVLPKIPSKWDPSSYINNELRLYFLCECGEHTKVSSGANTKISHDIHLAKHEGYDLKRPKEFLQKYGSYMLKFLETTKIGVLTTGTAFPALAAVNGPGFIDICKDSVKAVTQSEIDDSIKYLQGLASSDSTDLSAGPNALRGADFRQLEEFIKDKDKHRVLGNLYRIVTQEGHVKWVCIDHYDLLYKKKEQQAFTEAVEVNGGTYDQHLGQVVVRLGSKPEAVEFFSAFAKARRVDVLNITFAWECSKSELEELRKTLAKSRVSILRLVLQQFRTSPVTELLWTSASCNELSHIMELRNLKEIRIVLPKEFIGLLKLQPKRPSHLHILSIEMVPKSIEEKDLKELADALKINATLTTLNFTHSSIGDNGAQMLLEALKANSTLTTLNLRSNSIGLIGAQALSKLLKINSSLTTLHLDSNSIGDDGAQVLSTALEANSALTTLDLENNSIESIGARALAVVIKLNSTLTTLDLTGNSIRDDGARALSRALRNNSTLTSLDLKGNSIGDIGAQVLSAALEVNSTLTSLSLSDNSIGNIGAQALSAALKKNSTLTTLDLGANLIANDGAQALSKALKFNSTLTTLNLWGNLIGFEGAFALFLARGANPTLITVNLENNLVKDSTVLALSAALKIDSTLATLDLRGNLIGDNGALALSEALRHGLNLVALDLRRNAIRNNGAQVLSEALRMNSTLTTLNLGGNSIEELGAQTLSAALRINSTITSLNLGDNSIRVKGSQALSKALRINSTLTILGLSNNSIGDIGAQALSE
ncbi:hypothetical protein BGZ99_010121, partial [Dissophora globulifera]